MALPTFTVGRKVRASELAALVAEITNRSVLKAIKGGDESVSSATSGATLHNDTALFLPVAANTTYRLDLTLLYNEASGTSLDLKAAWTAPAGARLDLAVVAPHNAWVATAGSALEAEWAAWQGVNLFPSPTLVFGTSTTVFSAHVRGIVTIGATAGVLQFQWAQNAGNAAAVTVKRGSALTLTPLI